MEERDDERAPERPTAAQARLFDVRRAIGGIFVVYGLILSGMGLFASPAAKAKAQGVNINLWAGLSMLVFGLLFLLWQWWRPAEAPDADEDRVEEVGPPEEHEPERQERATTR